MIFALLLAVAIAQPFYVYDGDTVRVGTEKYRLQGIDAPEMHQLCKDEAGKDYACGIESRNTLLELIKDKPVTCKGDEIDKYGRTLGTCFVGDINLNEAMVSAGEAVAYLRYSKAYAVQEIDAKANKRGIWRGEFMQPEQWRHTHESHFHGKKKSGVGDNQAESEASPTSGGKVDPGTGHTDSGQNLQNEKQNVKN